MKVDQSTRNRLILGGLALLFALPLVLAWWLTSGARGLISTGAASHGTLLEHPYVPGINSLSALDGRALGPNSLVGRWTLIYLAGGPCAKVCQTDLHNLRQVRLTLGEDAHRVQRWLVTPLKLPVGERRALLRAHPGLRIARAPRGWPRQGDVGGEGAAGRTLVIDPRGYLIMFYASGQSPRGLIQDLKRLLKASYIG